MSCLDFNTKGRASDTLPQEPTLLFLRIGILWREIVAAALLLLLAHGSALAYFDWNNDISSTCATVATFTHRPSVKIGDTIRVASRQNRYGLRIFLESAPIPVDFGTISLNPHGAFSPMGSLPGKALKGALYDDGKTLEWRIERTDLGNSCYLNGELSAGATGGENGRKAASKPIPAAAWLLGTGIVGLIGIRRRSHKLG